MSRTHTHTRRTVCKSHSLFVGHPIQNRFRNTVLNLNMVDYMVKIGSSSDPEALAHPGPKFTINFAL